MELNSMATTPGDINEELMYAHDVCNALYSRLSFVEMELNTMATTPGDITEELIVAQEQKKDLTEFTIIKKILHCFMINHGFFLDTPFEFFNEQSKFALYRLRYRPEFVYSVKLSREPEETSVDVIMKLMMGGVERAALASVRQMDIPSVTRESMLNDEFAVEKLLIFLAFKFSKLWTFLSYSSSG